MMADLLIERLGGEPFSWGGGVFADAGELSPAIRVLWLDEAIPT